MIVSKTSAEGLLGKKLDGLGGGRRSYYVLSADGTKNLGGPYTKPQATKRLQQVEFFKRRRNPKKNPRSKYDAFASDLAREVFLLCKEIGIFKAKSRNVDKLKEIVSPEEFYIYSLGRIRVDGKPVTIDIGLGIRNNLKDVMFSGAFDPEQGKLMIFADRPHRLKRDADMDREYMLIYEIVRHELEHAAQDIIPGSNRRPHSQRIRSVKDFKEAFLDPHEIEAYATSFYARSKKLGLPFELELGKYKRSLMQEFPAIPQRYINQFANEVEKYAKKRYPRLSAPMPIPKRGIKRLKRSGNPRKTLYIKPNESAKKVAGRALERRKKLPRSKRGGLDAMQAHEEGVGSGVMRARDIASGKRINAYQVKAFFDRHRGNYVKAKADGKRWEDSKAWQAWDLWGGEPLRKQVESAVRKDNPNGRGPEKILGPEAGRRIYKAMAGRRPFTVANAAKVTGMGEPTVKAGLDWLTSKGFASHPDSAGKYRVCRQNPEGKGLIAENPKPFGGKFRHPGWIRLRPDKPISSATMTAKAPKKPTKKSSKKKGKMAAVKANPKRSPRGRAYNVYVVQEKKGKLYLYTFGSKDLIQPTVSAMQYEFLLRSAPGKVGDTHIFNGDAALRTHLKKHVKKKIAKGRVLHTNPRNSKVKDALAVEATRHKKFADFASAYWDACSRGLYWYATDEKRFYIGDHERRLVEGDRFCVSCSPALALSGKNEQKKYVAELDVTKVPNKNISVKKGTHGADVKVTGAAGSVKVTRVLEADKALRAFKWQLSILPSSKEELREVWRAAWEKRRKRDEIEATRRRKEKEREELRAEKKRAKDIKAKERVRKKKEKEKEEKRKARVTRGKEAIAARKRREAKATAGKVAKPAKKTTKKKVAKKAAKKKVSKTAKGYKRTRVAGSERQVNPGDVVRKIPSTINNPGC